MLPPVYVRFSYSYKSDELVCGAKEIAIEKVELEKRFDDVIPDVVVYAGGKQLFIEIYVTHSFIPQRLGCGQNLGLIMQQSQDDVYTQSDSARREIA